MKDRVYFSNLNNPKSWDTPHVKTIKFPFNIEKVLRWIFNLLGR